jgi:hypothetical protein
VEFRRWACETVVLHAIINRRLWFIPLGLLEGGCRRGETSLGQPLPRPWILFRFRLSDFASPAYGEFHKDGTDDLHDEGRGGDHVEDGVPKCFILFSEGGEALCRCQCYADLHARLGEKPESQVVPHDRLGSAYRDLLALSIQRLGVAKQSGLVCRASGSDFDHQDAILGLIEVHRTALSKA